MELQTHPLLALVESNRNRLKSMLTSYIDSTVDNQFAFLKNHIVLMIQSGQIGPQQSHDVTAVGITLPPPTQANTDQSSDESFNEYSNGQFSATLEPQFITNQNILQNDVSLTNTITADEQMIKQEFDDEDEDVDEQVIDDDNDPKCEKCEKGICNLVRENCNNFSGDLGENGDDFLETQQNVDFAFEGNQMNQSIVSNDILPYPTNLINTQQQINQECLESQSITIHNRNAVPNYLLINEPIEGQNSPIDDDDDYYEDSENEHLNNPNCENCANGVCDLDHENNNNNHLNSYEPFETQHVDEALEDNQINQSRISNGTEETTHNANNELHARDQLHNVRRSNKQNSNKKEGHLIKRRIRRSALSEPIESSTPSTSGARSSTRKRIQKKVFGDDQSNDDDDKKPKSKKLKSVQSNNRSVKYHKQINIENADEDDIDDDDEDSHDNQEEVKAQVNVLKLNCTEPGCSQTVTSRALWREHMRNDHHKRPNYQLKNNARLNDRDQTEHPCIEPKCNVICTTHESLINHWKYYHHPGKYQCSTCLFEANLNYKVRSHFYITHGSLECPHNGCGKKFSGVSKLKRHERVHTGVRPYKCTWKKCQSSFKVIGHAVQHVRVMHFNLPRNTKEQNELNIIDSRNAHDYICKIEHLL